MNEQKDGSRKYDAANPPGLAEFMKTGWAPTPLVGIVPSEAIPFCKARIEKLSKKYPGKRVVLPAGGLKTRSSDTDYRFRAHSAFAYFTGITAGDTVPDSVFILEPNSNGHEALLFIHPRSSRDTPEFYRDAKYGEFLGCHMIGNNVTEMIAEAVVARKLETTAHEILNAVHPHPTMSEGLKEATAAAYGEAIDI